MHLLNKPAERNRKLSAAIYKKKQKPTSFSPEKCQEY